MLKLDPRQLMAIRAAVRASRRRQNLFGSANLDYNYRPVRGLLFSVLVHALLLVGMLFFPTSNRVSRRTTRFLGYAVTIDHNKMVVYLPPLGGKSHKRELEPVSKPDDMSTPAASPRRTPGLSYPGPQPIFSDFEEPTNHIQTVLQPSIPNLTILKPPLLLPNIVQVADAGPAPELKIPDPILKPAVKLALPLPLEQPVRVEPPAIASDIAIPESKSPEPPQKPPAALKLADQLKVDPPLLNSPIPVTGPDLRNFLALSPMPAVAEPALPDLPGEARGRFAISPEPNLAASEIEPGSRSTTGTSAGLPATSSNEAGIGPAKTEKSLGSGTDATRGSGASVGVGKNVFPGITILGGVGNSRTAGNSTSNAGTSPPLQTSYGITVLSSGFGSGLPNLGVFSNEQVYTAFLDMRRNTTDPVLSWTVEYALLKGTPGQSSVNSKPSGSQEGIVLPFPAFKELPAMPSELVVRYSRRMVIVYGIINTEGKMEQVVVKDSPDPRLNEPVLSALSKWVFRPAQRDGETVAAKILFGIPVWAPPLP